MKMKSPKKKTAEKNKKTKKKRLRSKLGGGARDFWG